MQLQAQGRRRRDRTQHGGEQRDRGQHEERGLKPAGPSSAAPIAEMPKIKVGT